MANEVKHLERLCKGGEMNSFRKAQIEYTIEQILDLVDLLEI